VIGSSSASHMQIPACASTKICHIHADIWTKLVDGEDGVKVYLKAYDVMHAEMPSMPDQVYGPLQGQKALPLENGSTLCFPTELTEVFWVIIMSISHDD